MCISTGNTCTCECKIYCVNNFNRNCERGLSLTLIIQTFIVLKMLLLSNAIRIFIQLKEIAQGNRNNQHEAIKI